MNEEEEIRARLNSLSRQINAGAAGALGNPIYKKEFPTNVSSNLFNVESPGTPKEQLAVPGDVIAGKPSLFDRLFGLTERVDSQGNVIPGDIISTIRHSLADGDYRYKPYPDMEPIQRGAFNVQFTYGQDPVGELMNRTPLGMLFDIPFIDYITPDFSEAEDFKFDPPVEETKIPKEYTSLEFDEFKPATVDWLTRDDFIKDSAAHNEKRPVFDYPDDLRPDPLLYGLSESDPRVAEYNELMPGFREVTEEFAKKEQDWFESGPDPSLYDMSTYFGEDFFEKQSADNLQKSQERNYLEKGIIDPWLAKEIELTEKNMRDLEAFNKRNEEEERLNREEYDKMVADTLAEQDLEASMDTDFSMGDLEQEDFFTKLDKFLDATIYNPIFDRPEGWGEAAEITPPSWLAPELSEESVVTDTRTLSDIYSDGIPLDLLLNPGDTFQSLLDTITGQPGYSFDTALNPQRSTFPNPNLFSPDTEFNTNIPNAIGGGGEY